MKWWNSSSSSVMALSKLPLSTIFFLLYTSLFTISQGNWQKPHLIIHFFKKLRTTLLWYSCFCVKFAALSSKIAVAQIKAKTTTSFNVYWYKKKRERVSSGFDRVARVPGDPPGRPGFTGPTPKRGFASTRTGPMPGRPGPESTRWADPSFKTLKIGVPL